MTIPKRYQPLLFFVAMLLAFDVAYSLLSTCQEPIYPSAAEQGGHQYHCTPFGGIFFSFGVLPLTHFLHAYEHELVAGFTIVLAFSTVALWLSTNKLWEATRDTAAKQEQDTRILQRAYISVEPGGIQAHNARGRIYIKGDKGPPQSVPHITIKNAGHLPARDIKWTIEHKFSEDRRLDDFPIDEGRGEGKNVLPPSGFMIQGGVIINVGESNPGELRLETDRFLYVWGIVVYDDGFGEARRTRFCHRYNCVNLDYVYDEEHPLSDGRKVWIGREIKSEFARYHRYGNDAD